MNEETKELQRRLNKDYLTIDDVIQYGDVGKIYLVIGKDPTVKYWFCKNKDGNVLVPADKEPYYSEISHRLLIIGNGFDLHCGTNSRYPVFFDEQFGISLAYEVEELCSKNANKNEMAEIKKAFIGQAKKEFNTYYYGIGYHDIEKLFSHIELKFLIQYRNKLLNSMKKLNSKQKISAGLILNQVDRKIEWAQGLYSKWDIVFFLAELFYSKQDDVNWSDIEKIIFYVINFLINGKLKLNLKIKNRVFLVRLKLFFKIQKTCLMIY